MIRIFIKVLSIFDVTTAFQYGVLKVNRHTCIWKVDIKIFTNNPRQEGPNPVFCLGRNVILRWLSFVVIQSIILFELLNAFETKNVDYFIEANIMDSQVGEIPPWS